MADELSKISFECDFEEVVTLLMTEKLIIKKFAKLEALVTISPKINIEEIFYAKFAWDIYPDNPPSLKFWDKISDSYDVKTAWPEIRGFRPGNLDACVNWTREGFVAHPEWKQDANLKWNSSGNALLRVVRILQQEFDNNFTKRFNQ